MQKTFETHYLFKNLYFRKQYYNIKMMNIRLSNTSKPFILLGLFFVFGCVNDSETKKYKIGFSQTGINDEWRKSMNQAMEIQVGFYPELELKILDSDDNIDNQVKDIEQLIAEKIDILIVSPIKSKPITPIVEKAFKSGIPVLIVDRKTDGDNYTAYLGGDNYEVGTNAANYLASLANKNKKIIEIKGLAGSSPALERSLGFNDVVNATKNLEVVKTIEGNWESYSIKDSLRNVLESIKGIDYIFVHNDRMALGAWEIVKEKKLQDHIKIIGVDGLNGPNGGIQLVKEGKLLATILYPTGGDEAIQLVLKILSGERVAKNNILSTTVIDSRNADIMSKQFDKIYQQQQNIDHQHIKISNQEKRFTTQKQALQLLLALLIISVVLGTYSIYSTYNIKKKKRELEIRNKKITIQRNQIKKIAEEVKISNEAKVNFFTGLSHEFKTPITLILSSTESLTENKIIRDNKLLSEVGLIYNNSKRLLRLINQLLDFRKIEDRKFVLKASKTNLYQFSNLVFKDFEREAQRRNINFTISTNNEDLPVFIDRNLMDKVYFNLLSNAFKFTPNNGTISIEIKDKFDSNFVKIHFKDSGIGIPKKEMNHVFQAFFQGSNNNKTSSGIGLHLSKEFIELHKGTIEVISKHGTEFIITLYKDNVHLDSDEIIYEVDIVDSLLLSSNFDYEDDSITEQLVLNDEDHYSILIIEDNLDLVKYLKGKLSLEYSVSVSDGTDGIEKALELIPDIILCDVSLPGKSGFDICKILKKDLRTSHIPTIILTALNNKESYIKGLESGADLYLTKPFSFSILAESIKTLIYNREKLRYYFLNNVYNIDASSSFGSMEQEFILKLNKIIDNNMDNSKFSVENLANDLNISRIQLYRKMKAIMGVNVSDYIQNIRLEKAKKMLRDTSLTISEIAYATGFSTPNYFSTSFKNKFNKSPKAFRE
ncbi:substrate-binding domain-containing protein [Flavivirga sp. 57AJ16]|uniref:substrate-binding domain-containing protein n=1 Tax=Flavivirga sp. 57AJ16 TaxID=3025307 RepID=UPI002365343E|nr:substrate-binding domain-containing protein [Flavivirga sp. 57AJ16]MDD7887693.1 substrate-binding domain-containing protein [Flavivirga sp. 57AJ16]